MAFEHLDRLNPTAATADEFFGKSGLEMDFPLPEDGSGRPKLATIAIGRQARGSTRRGKLLNGFIPRSEGVHRAYNFSVALVIFIAVLPMLAIIAALLLVTQGRPIFYRGVRLGVDKTEFGILKFRTLDDKLAAELTRERVLPPGTGIETPLGHFLRDTRLDELPQLWNVLSGDMNICGPRPVRPEIAAAHELTIPHYAQRFRVRPGMIGPTQAYMNHGTSKAIRARFNNVLCRSPVNYRSEIGVILLVGACVLARTGSQLWKQVREGMGAASDSGPAAGVAVTYQPDGADRRLVLGVNAEELVIAGEPLDGAGRAGRLFLQLPNGQRRFAAIVIEPAASSAPQGSTAYRYRPRTDFAEYVLSRYLHEKVVVPHRSQFLGARLRRAVGAGFRRGQGTLPERLEHSTE